MLVQEMSDLHFEMHRDKGASFLKSIKPAAEVLVLAGDICSARFVDQPRMMFEGFAEKFKHVIFVSGNHEFYGTDLQHGWINIRNAARGLDNVHVLDNESCTIDGVDFFGGSGWFPPFDADPAAVAAKQYMNDFYQIKDLEKGCHVSNFQFACRMDGDVIVSHHLPTKACVAPAYKGDALNAFFVADFDVEHCGAKLWTFGHTHEQTDIVIGSTRCVSNPHGYPNEIRQNNAFQEALVLTV